jgi:NAD(P)-dependent dehydrogenase (short-subunit alcohol dehydrogenase family)
MSGVRGASQQTQGATFLGAQGARELIGWLAGGDPVLSLTLPTGAGDPARTLVMRRPESEPRLLDRHVLDWAPIDADGRVDTGAGGTSPVPALPANTVLLTNSAAFADELDLPPDAVVVLAGVDGVTVRAGGAPARAVTAERLAALLTESAAAHVRVLVDGSDPALATASWSAPMRALLTLHEWMFLAVQACAGRLSGDASVLVTAVDAVRADGTPLPFTGLFTGFVKSLALEFPEVPVVASVHGGGRLTDVLDRAATDLGAPRLLPVVVHVAGERRTLRATAREAAPSTTPPLEPGALVVAAGGGRGIGAPILAELARRYRPRIVILGSTALDEYPAEELAVGVEEGARTKAAHIRGLVTGPDRIPVSAANARFERLQEARAVAGNLAGLARHCGRDAVTYLRCDLRDEAAVRTAMSQVAERHGDIALLINIAGTNRASDVATKSLANFRTVRDLKLHTYLNLKAALADRPPRRWCNFGSFVGFTGQVGETDYASANDFLYSAAANGDGEHTIGWTLWRDIGLGASPVMRAFLAKSNQYTATSTEEGVAHFVAELSDPATATVFYGDAERAAIAAAVPGYAAFCAAARPAAARSFFFLDRVTRGDGELTAERTFDLDRDGYLVHHKVHGYPTLPGTFVPELAAQAAVALVPHRVPVVFEDLRLESFLRVYREDRKETKRIHARLVASDDVESVVEVRVLGDLVAPNGTTLAKDRLHFAVTVRLRDTHTPAPRWEHWPDHGSRPLSDPYHADTSDVLLTGVFKSTSDTRMHPLGRRGRLALDPAGVARWFPDLIVPSVLLDGLVRVAVLDLVEGRWTPVAIPRTVRRIDLYQPHTDATLAASGLPVELYVTPVDLDLEDTEPDNRAIAVAADGEVLLQVKDIVGAIVGYVDQDTGRFVDRKNFDAGQR